jgi:PAS domain S-box-containing protein
MPSSPSCPAAPPDVPARADLNAVIVDATASLIVVLDRGGRIVRFNRACEIATGYSLAEVAGKAPWDFLLDALEGEVVRRAFHQIIGGCVPRSHEADWLTRDGRRRRIVWSNSAVLGDDGAVELVVGCGNDITDRRTVELKLRESEERYALAVRGANDGLWDWDLRTDRLYFSARWKAMLGCADDEIGHAPDDWFDRVHPDDLARVKDAIAAHLAGNTPHVEVEHRALHQGGHWRWMLARGLAIRDAACVPYRMAGSLSDITDRKAVETRLVHEALYD